MALEASRQLNAHAALLPGLESPERVLAFSRAKYLAATTAIKVTNLALQVYGWRGLVKAYLLERYYRDVRAGLVMGPGTDSLSSTIGIAELGLQAPRKKRQDPST